MATRSTIALEFADGTVGQVYCHWDGYLDHNGRKLLENWSDPYKLRELIELGSVSSLREEIGVKHNPDSPSRFADPVAYEAYKETYGHMTTFHGRDYGQSESTTSYFKNFEEYEKEHDYQEYEYILRNDGVWYVSQGGDYEPLMEAIIEMMREEAEEEDI